VRAAGISRATFDQWWQKDRSGKAEHECFREFAERVEQARAEGEVRTSGSSSAAPG
jgi:hypothetical protein